MKAILSKITTNFIRYRESIKIGAVLGSLIANFIILGIVFNNSQQTADLAHSVRQLVISRDKDDADRQRESEERLARALADNVRQHEKTQRYMLCIANILLKPVAERDAAAFDRCGLVGVDGSSSSSSSSNRSPVAPTPQSTSSPASPQPTTSGPPDPEKEGGLVGGLLRTVQGLVDWLLGN